MRIFTIGTVIIISLLQSCQTPNSSTTTKQNLTSGIWHAQFQIKADQPALVLPFKLELKQDTDQNWSAIISNADEQIEVAQVIAQNDSVTITLAVFDTEIKAQIRNDSLIGRWYDYGRKGNYHLPFSATKGEKPRFATTINKEPVSFDGRWQTVFSPNTEDAYDAIGEFKQEGHKVTGTFLTETGDYRYLEGVADGNVLKLSCFDGAHAFLFEATQLSDSTLKGQFYSGNHWQEPWQANRNENVQLRNPDSLTYLKEGYDRLAFRFPNLSGDSISLTNARFTDKVTIVQLFGTWCPNCMDESKFLNQLYNKYHTQGLEVVALAYEKVADSQRAIQNIKKFKQNLGINYEFLLAGQAKKAIAAETLPMLNHIMSYPTAIFIDRKGEVRKIHTGFYGPGTGIHYDRFTQEMQQFVEQLLAEQI